jgi:hypothetical protein
MTRREKQRRIKETLLFYASDSSIRAKAVKGVEWDSETAPKSA